jgi:hypothetical protein
MENSQKMFFDFIMERTQDGKQEAMAAALESLFKPPQDGGFDPDAFKRGIEVITSMLKPEAVPEFQRMMSPPGMDDNGEPPEIINPLVQPNKYKWRVISGGFQDRDAAALACTKRRRDSCDC